MKKVNKKPFSALIIVFAMVTGILVQSCQVEDNFEDNNPEKELALNEFENMAKNVMPNIKKVVLKQQFQLKSKKLTKSKNQNYIEAKEVKEQMLPLVKASKKLLVFYGINENDLEEIFTNTNDPRLVLIGILILENERKNSRIASLNSTNKSIMPPLQSLMTIQTANAEMPPCLGGKYSACHDGNRNDDDDSVGSESDLYDCALRTLGITALTEAFDKGISSSAGKALMKKAVRKIAARTLGWVGAAWAAYEFGDCMKWW